MLEGRKFSKLKKLMSILLLLCTVVSSFCNIGVVQADSNDLRTTYIQMMSGRNVSNITGAEDLTTDDLRCIALYLSNFYVPFNTSLDPGSQEDMSDLMINSLVTIGMKEDVAKSLIDATYQASLSSASQLYVSIDELRSTKASEEGTHYGIGSADNDPGIEFTNTLSNDDYIKLVGESIVITDVSEVNGESVTSEEQYTPVTAFLWSSIVNHVSGGAGNTKEEINNTKISFYYYDGTNMIKCFSLDNYTLSILVNYLDASGVASNGNAMNSIISISNLDTWETLTDNEKAAISSVGEKLYVDWVGNILYDAGDKRVVIVPACMNTSAFTDFHNNSKYNMVSSWGMYTANTRGSYSEGSISIPELSLSTEWKLQRGKDMTATWDTEAFKVGTGVAGDVRAFWQSLGIVTGVTQGWGLFANDTVGTSSTNEIKYKSGAFSISSDGALTDIMVYASISDSKLNSLGSNYNSVFKTASLCSEALYSSAFTSGSKFTIGSDDIDSYISFGSAEKQMLSNFFLTYAFAYANKDATSFDESVNYINMKFNEKAFPKADTVEIEWNDVTDVASFIEICIYLFLHPTEGIKYVTTLLKNKISGFFLGFHEDTVGSTSSNSSTGMTRYLGFSGYATTPNLSDISWLDSLVENYNNIIVYLIILMCMILLCYVLVGSLTLQRSVIGIVIFGTLAFIPPLAINTSIDMTNKVCDTIFSNKFQYWAICQLQTYIGDLNSLQNVSSTEEYVAKLMDIQSGGVASSTSFTGVRLKWMTPKKFSDLAEASEEINNSLVGSTFSTSFTNLMINNIANASATEDYSDSIGKTYLYRDACDIYRYASLAYNLYDCFNWNGLSTSETYRIASTSQTDVNKGNNFTGKAGKFVELFGDISCSNGSLKDYLLVNNTLGGDVNLNNISEAIKDTSSLTAISRGFLYDTLSLDDSGVAKANYYNTSQLATTYLITYRDTLATIHDNYTKLVNYIEAEEIPLTANNIKSGDILFGLEPSNFTLSLNDITEQEELPSRNELSGFYYALYAESPFYYFNFNIRDQYKATGLYAYNYNNLETGSSFYKMLTNDNQSYFFNLAEEAGDGYGELRDFMNFHDLFYYVIPALKEGNEVVDIFDSVWGMFTYDDCSLVLSSDGKFTYDKDYKFDTLQEFVQLKDTNDRDSDGNTSELLWDTYTEEERYEFWHDYNVWTIFNNYVTWLDTMQDCDYAKAETITVMGDKFYVSNPLDPTTYFSMDSEGNMNGGRYMVFSESEMKYYGLTTANLTTVEQKIINIQKSVYKTSIDLMNYYTLSDEVLIESMALIELFEFNKEFSQESIISSDYILYPQGYELKAFTYDAYLRLIVAEASGEDLMTESNTSLYERIAQNTSLFFGVFLLLNDLLAVYVIPLFKLFILVLLFLISILIIVGASVKLEYDFIKVFWQSIMLPLVAYSGIGVGMAYIVSLFMSNGSEGVVKKSITISLGDPTMALIVMLIVNTTVIILYYRLTKHCFMSFVNHIKAVFNSMSGAVIGAATGLTKGVVEGKVVDKFGHKDSVSTKVASTAKQRGRDNNPINGRNSLTSNQALLASAAGGSLISSDSQATELQKQRDEDAKHMNKYDKKAYESANKKADMQQEKYESVKHKLDVAKANNMSKRKIVRLQKAVDKAESKYKSAESYASAINTNGKFGARKSVGGSLSYKTGRFVANTENKVDAVNNMGRAFKINVKKGANTVLHPIKSSKKAVTNGSAAMKKKLEGIGTKMQNDYDKGYVSARK